MTRISIRSSRHSYAVQIAPGMLRGVAKHPRVTGRHAVVISSAPVFALWGEELLRAWPKAQRPAVLLHRDGERAKSITEFARLHSLLSEAGARRDSVLLALGGGVTGDLAGFVAATYMRGIGYIQLPTTLLAQVDSSIGGKTGIDIPEGKNLVGAFHPPLAVLSDTRTLATLSPRNFRAGLYECIKTAILGDAALFRFLEQHYKAIVARDEAALARLVSATARVKARIVASDEHESGPRMLLNFGHTFGHAIESSLNFTRLLHGEAVAWGMLAAIHASLRAGLLGAADADRMRTLITSFGALPRFTLIRETVLTAMSRDKKNSRAQQRFILTSGIGHAEVSTLPPAIVRSTVDHMLAEAAR